MVQSTAVKLLLIATALLIPATGIYSAVLMHRQAQVAEQVRSMAVADGVAAFDESLPVVFGSGSLLGFVQNALVVRKDLPANSVKELIALARVKPGDLSMASAGSGTTGHLSGELFKSMAGVSMTHIPYRGSAPAFTDLMGGQVQFMAESIPQAAAYHKQGKVRALAVTSKERNPALPDVPTVIESGIKGFEVVGFYGFLAPAGTPKEAVNKLSEAFGQVLQMPDVRNRMVSQGADPAFLGSEDFAKFLASEMPRWAEAVKKSGAKLD